MPEPVELRRALAAFLGGDRYRKFILQGFRQGRLRYWQEQEWGRFTAAHPEFAVGLEELAVIVRRRDLPGEEWQRRRRFATTAAGLAGGLVGGAVYIGIVYGCCLLYVRLYPQSGGRFQYLPELVYISFALCVAPLSVVYGAGMGVWWARSRKSAFGGKIPTPPELPPRGSPPIGSLER